MDQIDRTSTLNSFRNGENSILIGTALVARGIDVQNIELVINYDVPNHYEDYVHQVGRTARANKEGTAYTFIKPNEEFQSSIIVKALQKSGAVIPLDLSKLYEKFLKKKKKKLIKDKPLHGFFNVKGFQFNEDEVNEKDKEVKRQMKLIGVDEEGNAIQGEINSNDWSGSEGVNKLSNVEKAKLLSVVAKKSKEINKNVSSVKQAKAFLAQIAIQAKVKEMMQSSSGSEDPVKTECAAEIEINDYPQKARWKVTRSNSEDLYRICDMFNCNVTPKGVFVAPGESLPSDAKRKLYLMIEGTSQEEVDNCRLALYRLLENASQLLYNDPRLNRMGRYSVL